MNNNKTGNLVIENARIIFRNFSGKENQFNRKGSRNFCVIISDDAKAKQLSYDGWNIKTLKPKDKDDEPIKYIQVAVNFDVIPPNIYMITRKAKTRLDIESVSVLDFAEIVNIDIIIRPYNWTVNGKDGVKAYLKTMYVTIEEDEFAEKYAEEEHPWE